MEIQKHKEYSFRLMPNFFDIKNPVLSIEFCLVKSDNSPSNITKQHFMYVLNDGKIDYIKFGYTIKHFIEIVFNGFYATSEGYLICKSGLYEDSNGNKLKNEFIPKFYIANFDKTNIEFDFHNQKYTDKYLKEHEMSVYTDIIEYKPINLFDIKGEYILNFKTDEKHGFLNLYHMRLIKSEPIYKDGDDKNVIINLYNNVEHLDVIVENYKKKLVDDYKKVLFDVEARTYYWNFKQGKIKLEEDFII